LAAILWPLELVGSRIWHRRQGLSPRQRDKKYIQQQAAKDDGRFVTIGPLVFFSTETGDAWMLEPSCQLAARLARDGDPEPIDFQEADTNYAIGWKGNYRI
jgi:hypothetical protein